MKKKKRVKKIKENNFFKSKVKIKLTIILVTSVLLVCGVGITYSLFISKGNLHVDQKIAKFVFNAKKTDTIQLPITDLNPGDEASYNFQVTNNLNNKKSEVTVNYEIILKTYNFMPLDINLYKVDGDSDELIVNCNEYKFSRDQTTKQVVCNAEVAELSHNNELSDDYRLDVSFPKQYNSSEYSELVDHIEIQIKSWQKMRE